MSRKNRQPITNKPVKWVYVRNSHSKLKVLGDLPKKRMLEEFGEYTSNEQRQTKRHHTWNRVGWKPLGLCPKENPGSPDMGTTFGTINLVPGSNCRHGDWACQNPFCTLVLFLLLLLLLWLLNGSKHRVLVVAWVGVSRPGPGVGLQWGGFHPVCVKLRTTLLR